MCFSDSFISTYQGGQRYALRSRKRRVPPCAVFHRAYFLAPPVHVFSGRLVADELFACDRLLPFAKPMKVLLADLTAQSPLFGKPSVPLPVNLLPFGVVVLSRVAKLFRVIRLCLACAQRLRDCQHCVGLLEEVPLLACWLSLDFLFRTLLLFICNEFLPRSSIPRRLACSCRGRRNLRRFLGWLLCRALDVLPLFALKLDVRETHPRHEIPALEITVHLFKAADLACHHQRPDLAFEVIALRLARLWELLICAALPYPLDFLLSYGVANPFRCMRLARAQEDFRRRLRHHRLRFVSVTHFQLAASLKTQYHRVVRFAVLRDRRVQLRQQLHGVGYHAQRTKHAIALWRRVPVDHRRVLRSFHSPVDLFRVRHPRHQLLRRRVKAQQVCKDFSRGLHEERIFIVPVGEKRCCQSQSIGPLPQLISRSPVRHPLVQRIENQIAAR